MMLRKLILTLTFFCLLVFVSYSQYDRDPLCASKNQRCGLLSDDGDTLIPFIFKFIYRNGEHYQTYRDIGTEKKPEGFWRLYDKEGNQPLPGDYSWIEKDTTAKAIYFRGNGETTIYFTETQKQITRPHINNVDWYKMFDENGVKRSYILLTSDFDGSELMDSSGQTIFTTPEYIHYPHSPHNTSVNNMIYLYGSPMQNKVGFLNSKGEVIAKNKYVDLIYPYDHWTSFGDGNAFIAYDGKHYDFYPESGAEPSTGYEYLHFWENQLTAKKNGKWMLLDQDLNVLYSDRKYGVSLNSGFFNPMEFNYEDMIHEGSVFYGSHLISGLPPESGFIYQIEFGKAKKDCGDYGKNCIKELGKVGIKDIHSNKSIPVKYNYILTLPTLSLQEPQYQKHYYYWAVSHNEKEKLMELTIYNDNLKATKTVKLSDRSIAYLQQDKRPHSDTVTKILVNDEGFYGLMRSDGSMKVPFTYSRLYLTTLYNQNHFKHLFMGNSEAYGLFDTEGNLLLPVAYDTIYYPNRFNFNFLVAEKSNIYTLYFGDTEKKIEGISKFFEASYIPRPDEFFYSTHGQVHYCVKDGYLYSIENQELLLMDEKRVRFKNGDQKSYPFGRFTFDRTGKVLESPAQN